MKHFLVTKQLCSSNKKYLTSQKKILKQNKNISNLFFLTRFEPATFPTLCMRVRVSIYFRFKHLLIFIFITLLEFSVNLILQTLTLSALTSKLQFSLETFLRVFSLFS